MAENRDDRGDQTIMDIHVDTRQVVAGCLRSEILRAIGRSHADESERAAAPDRIVLEEFKSLPQQHCVAVQRAVLAKITGLGTIHRQEL